MAPITINTSGSSTVVVTRLTKLTFRKRITSIDDCYSERREESKRSQLLRCGLGSTVPGLGEIRNGSAGRQRRARRRQFAGHGIIAGSVRQRLDSRQRLRAAEA